MLAYLEQSGLALAQHELSGDPMAPYLSPALSARIVEECRALGDRAARDFFSATTDLGRLLAEQGVTVERHENSCDLPNLILYSEYYQNKRLIVLYPKAIRRRRESLCADPRADGAAYEALEVLFLVHELFHHLECTTLGITYEKYRVKGTKLGPFQTHSHVRAASEIGAHAFVETYQQIREAVS